MSDIKSAPAFDFFPERWIAGTRHMSKVERCDYLDLLCFQWTELALPADLQAIARILNYRKPSQISEIVIAKFPISDDGKRRNLRLEVVRTEQHDRMFRRKVGAAIAHAKVNGVERLTDEERKILEASGNLVGGVLVVKKQGRNTPASKVASNAASNLPPPTTHHPPPTPLDLERETRARLTVPEWIEKIRITYPRQGEQQESEQAIRAAIDRGIQTPEQIWNDVKACAGWVELLEADHANGFVPCAGAFFGRGQWQDPKKFEGLYRRHKEAQQRGGSSRPRGATPPASTDTSDWQREKDKYRKPPPNTP
jgi:uncharacterized protein YdaU (DUF1376 family)